MRSGAFIPVEFFLRKKFRVAAGKFFLAGRLAFFGCGLERGYRLVKRVTKIIQMLLVHHHLLAVYAVIKLEDIFGKHQKTVSVAVFLYVKKIGALAFSDFQFLGMNFTSNAHDLPSEKNEIINYRLTTTKRAMGIEPTSSAWKAEVIPLYHARMRRTQMRIGVKVL